LKSTKKNIWRSFKKNSTRSLVEFI
jgi:hypothetical protein